MYFNPIAVIILLCGALTLFIAIYAWRRRSIPAAHSFALFMGAVSIYVLGYSLELASRDLGSILFWNKIEYIGILSFPTLFLIFAIQYSGRQSWLNRSRIILLFIIPAVFLVLKFFDNQLHLIYVTTWLDTSGIIPLLSFTRGPLYWVIVAYNLLVITSGIFLIYQKRRGASALYRQQTSVMLAAAALVYGVYGYYLTGLPVFPGLNHLDLNPFIYTLWGGAVALAIFRYRLFNLTPLARDALIEILNDAVVVLDGQTRLVDANPAALKLFGWRQLPNGQVAEQCLPGWIEPAFLDGLASSARKETQITHADSTRYFELMISALRDKQADKIGYLIVAHDITERRAIEQGLRESEEKFRRMAETTASGLYIYDGERYVNVNPAFQQITGYSELELNRMKPWDVFHPSQRQMVEERAAARLRGEDVISHYEVKILTRSKQEKWVDMSVALISYLGKPATLGTFFDITEQKKLEESLRTSQQLYLDIVEGQTDPIARWLSDTTLTFVNTAYCDYYGKTRQQLLGTRFITDLPPETQQTVQNNINLLLNRAGGMLSGEEMNIAPNGEKRWTVWVNRPVEDAQGNIVEFQSAGYDITERKLAEQALQQANEDLESQLEKVNVLQEQLLEQAVRDVLTGLFNRRYLQETLDREIARAGREDYPISLIMLDLDHFKILNDTFGHKAGDLILQSVGQIFLSHTRRMDIACRFGGEEFVII